MLSESQKLIQVSSGIFVAVFNKSWVSRKDKVSRFNLGFIEKNGKIHMITVSVNYEQIKQNYEKLC